MVTSFFKKREKFKNVQIFGIVYFILLYIICLLALLLTASTSATNTKKKAMGEKNITPFDGKKYLTWKLKIRDLLDENGVLEVIDKKPGEVADKWKSKEMLAKSLITKNLSDSCLFRATNGLMELTAKEIFKNLDAIYERKGYSGTLFVLRELYSLKLKGHSLIQHFQEFDELIDELSATGTEMCEVKQISYLLRTLPSSYDEVIAIIEQLPDENKTLAIAKKLLLDHNCTKPPF